MPYINNNVRFLSPIRVVLPVITVILIIATLVGTGIMIYRHDKEINYVNGRCLVTKRDIIRFLRAAKVRISVYVNQHTTADQFSHDRKHELIQRLVEHRVRDC